ncbi:radical SAM family heme chaperone HemW [Polaribacter tangerinus]|uniref:radical SAM family heme chaperone HemW n=1 Tax=Polaribacter tangerinus TaxID=1920034 RepID=UPI000B4AA9E1|nr:radical SAM family heme chaperone HemW [Polaribacter tangerinus]
MPGIYIHIPFCKQACFYCDFHFSTSTKKKDAMILSLIKEMSLRKQELLKEKVTTIYFGGGTPSILSTSEINSLIEAVYTNFEVVEEVEITLEANPDDLSEEKIKALSKSRVNRLSIGIQSFDENDLQLMNRAHNAGEAKKSLELATQYFENISLDLIYGIPGSTTATWLENINTALRFNVPHISSYALVVEPKTALEHFIATGKIKTVEDVVVQKQFLQLTEMLEAAGYIHYELSSFSKPAFFSKNNTAYWMGKSYLGIGPSAHSFNGKERSWNVKNNSKYIKDIAQNILPLEKEILSIEDRYNEYVMTGLRTMWGVSIDKINSDYGLKFAQYILQRSQKYRAQKLLSLHNNTLKTTKKGSFLVDGIITDFFMVS